MIKNMKRILQLSVLGTFVAFIAVDAKAESSSELMRCFNSNLQEIIIRASELNTVPDRMKWARFRKAIQSTEGVLDRVAVKLNGAEFPTTGIADDTIPKSYALIQSSWGELPNNLKPLVSGDGTATATSTIHPLNTIGGIGEVGGTDIKTGDPAVKIGDNTTDTSGDSTDSTDSSDTSNSSNSSGNSSGNTGNGTPGSGASLQDPNTIDLNAFADEINQDLAIVTAFKKDMNALRADTANLSVERDFLKDQMNGMSGGGYGTGRDPKTGQKFNPIYRYEMPLAQPDGKGGVTFVDAQGKPLERTVSYSSLDHLKKRYGEISRELDRRERQSWFFSNKNDVFNRQELQVVTLKRLEILHHMIMDSEAKHPGQPLPASLKAIMDKLEALYSKVDPGQTGAIAMKFKPEYSPSWYVWQRLHLIELRSDWYSVVWKRFPNLRDDVKNNAVVQFIKQMPADEKEALGIDRIFTTKDPISIPLGNDRNITLPIPPLARYGYLAAPLATAGTGSLGVWTANFVTTIATNSNQKLAIQKCAENSSESSFNRCEANLLQTLYGSKPNHNNEKVRETIYKLDLRHLQYLKQQNDIKNNAVAIGKETDEQFKKAIGSYMLKLHPDDAKAQAPLIQKILSEKHASPEEKADFVTLQGKSPDLAADLQSFLDTRFGKNGNSDNTPLPTNVKSGGTGKGNNKDDSKNGKDNGSDNKKGKDDGSDDSSNDNSENSGNSGNDNPVLIPPGPLKPLIENLDKNNKLKKIINSPN